MRTKRLLLRPFEPTDVEDVLAYASDPEVARYRPLPEPYTRRDAEEFIAHRILADWSAQAEFAIVIESRVIGAIGLHITQEHQIAELGYLIGRRLWGRGIAPEAGKPVIDWAFQHYNLHKVYARTDVRNRQSWRVMEKLGMTRDGVLRGHWKLRDEHVDLVYYSLLRDEWNQIRRLSDTQEAANIDRG